MATQRDYYEILGIERNASGTEIATAYRIDGKVTEEFPMTLAEIERAEPIYERLEGWTGDLTGCRRYADLPAAARAYVERVEALVGVPVVLISVGPDRDETIVRSDPFTG